MLSKDPVVAQAGANEFRRHLLKLREGQQSSYEAAFLNDEVKMLQLEQFASVHPPSLLWRNKGAYSELFHFLAVRFLGAPDSVLECEGIHAKWKWIEHGRRGMKFKLLNAILKLMTYMHLNGGTPPPEELIQHVVDSRRASEMQYQALVANGEIAPGLRRDWLYRERFNLRPTARY